MNDEAAQRMAAALVTLAECNIPADIQELLVCGDPMRGIPQHVLGKVLDACVDYERCGRRGYSCKD